LCLQNYLFFSVFTSFDLQNSENIHILKNQINSTSHKKEPQQKHLQSFISSHKEALKINISSTFFSTFMSFWCKKSIFQSPKTHFQQYFNGKISRNFSQKNNRTVDPKHANPTNKKQPKQT